MTGNEPGEGVYISVSAVVLRLSSTRRRKWLRIKPVKDKARYGKWGNASPDSSHSTDSRELACRMKADNELDGWKVITTESGVLGLRV